MQGSVSSALRGQLDDIVRLCTKIESAVREADWEVAGTLLSRRHLLLETVFADAPASAAEAQELQTVAEQVMAFDRELMPMAETARGEAAEEMKKLRRGREAASAYQQNSS
ncbi:MAG: flagellar protein FliT [Gammaproteobacteria bacterium]|nr:flagellar protein FliT [Gammaproteobacteria bacterium]